MDAKTLAMYLGCDVMVTPYEGASYKCKLCGVVEEKLGGETEVKIRVFEDDGPDGYEGHGHRWFNEDEVELILRPLSSMSELEILEGKRTLSFSKWGPYTAEDVQWLLSKGFDLFSLIEKGEAISNEEPLKG